MCFFLKKNWFQREKGEEREKKRERGRGGEREECRIEIYICSKNIFVYIYDMHNMLVQCSLLYFRKIHTYMRAVLIVSFLIKKYIVLASRQQEKNQEFCAGEFRLGFSIEIGENRLGDLSQGILFPSGFIAFVLISIT